MQDFRAYTPSKTLGGHTVDFDTNGKQYQYEFPANREPTLFIKYMSKKIERPFDDTHLPQVIDKLIHRANLFARAQKFLPTVNATNRFLSAIVDSPYISNDEEDKIRNHLAKHNTQPSRVMQLAARIRSMLDNN